MRRASEACGMPATVPHGERGPRAEARESTERACEERMARSLPKSMRKIPTNPHVQEVLQIQGMTPKRCAHRRVTDCPRDVHVEVSWTVESQRQRSSGTQSRGEGHLTVVLAGAGP